MAEDVYFENVKRALTLGRDPQDVVKTLQDLRKSILARGLVMQPAICRHGLHVPVVGLIGSSDAAVAEAACRVLCTM